MVNTFLPLVTVYYLKANSVVIKLSALHKAVNFRASEERRKHCTVALCHHLLQVFSIRCRCCTSHDKTIRNILVNILVIQNVIFT